MPGSTATRDSELVVVSNRLPVHRVVVDDRKGWEISPGGLVSALLPVLQSRPSTWVGWSGTSETDLEPFMHDGIRNQPVPLTSGEIETFYEGFANRTIWPLYHDAIATPTFRRRWWQPYVSVNQRFAKIATDCTSKGGIMWIQDFHLQLVPAMVRHQRPDIRIGFFLHIPFPPPELFSTLPWRRQILEGFLGADVIGFQTRANAANFRTLARRYAGAVIKGRDLIYQGRTIRVDAFPISIDVGRYHHLAESEEVSKKAIDFRRSLGSARKIVLGVDRLDYTKGIDIRLKAFRELLKTNRIGLEDATFVQVAVPSRERVEEYKELKNKVDQLVGEINGTYGEIGRMPVHYIQRNMRIEELVALYLAADVMLVTPLRDGMNLVAKEYVASRKDNTGVLILSEFAGAAQELKSALIVNPHDIEDLSDSINHAITITNAEEVRRMRALRRVVRNNDVFKWADRFLEILER